MKTLERVMRVMTHINVGATLGTAAWLLWSGSQVVSGPWTRAPRGPAPTAPGLHRTVAPSCCLVPAAGPSLQARADQGAARDTAITAAAADLEPSWAAEPAVRMLARND